MTEAKRDYQAALRPPAARPQYAWYGLGQIAEAQDDTVAARDFYAKAVTADPDYALAAERLAALGGPPRAAIADPQAAGALHPAKPCRRPARYAGIIRLRDQAGRSDGTMCCSPPAPQADQDPAPAGRAAKRLRRPAACQRSAARPPNRPRQFVRQTPRGSVRRGEVQLGAWRSEAEAKAGWDKAQAQAAELLAGSQPHVVAADLPGKGRYYRLRVSPASGQSRGQFCDSLTAKGVGCFPVRD